MDLKELVKKYLSEGRMMQVATVAEGQPWICTVYFVNDGFNIYWISTPERRHSKEIGKTTKTAIAIPIKYVPGEDVVGLQMEGEAALVDDKDEIKRAMRLYTDRYSRGEEFYEDFIASKNSHKLYGFKPNSIVVFDEENFDQPRQEMKI